MADWTSEFGVAIVAAVLAALLAYVFSVVVTRKGALHDAKLAAYSRISGLYGETLSNFATLSDLADMDSSAKDKETVMRNILKLSTALSLIGDLETTAIFADEGKTTKAIEEKGEEQFIKELRSRATLLYTDAMLKSIRELTFRAGELLLVRPTKPIVKALTDIQSTLASGNAIILGRLETKYPGVSSLWELPEGSVGQPKNPKVWKEEIEIAHAQLVKAMDEDLRKTFSWRGA